MAAEPGARTRVLLAEDEPTVAHVLGELISGDPSMELVGVARDAAEAAEMAGRTTPDVAVVDVKMPGGGGPRAAREIRERSPGTAILALSAYEDQSSVLQMLRVGAVGYLVKGGTVDQILEGIRRAVRGQSVLSAEVAGNVVRELAAHLARDERTSEQVEDRRRRVLSLLSGGGPDIALQPIAELATGRVVGVEALARFREPPQRPDLWFEEAAAVGLRTELEVAALRSALDRLPALPSGAYLSVNMSPAIAAEEAARETLAQTSSDRVVLEITEHAPVEDYDVLGQVLADVRSQGTRLAVDDAGAGFASLRHILRLEPDIIKLDITLTRAIDQDRARRALASGLIAFASEIGAAIVAEGIETREEIQALQDLGVEYGQGYFLARPAPEAPPAALALAS
ncbi:MAG TPA: EAL domain-containing protein [Actinomycetota bacterium]|nr:EAL domain-containing protein [Actinomycetota bacterium]